MSYPNERGPIVQQELLTQHLVKLRHNRGFTQEQLSKELSWSVAKVKRFEAGAQTLPLRMLETLLGLYGIAHKPLGKQLRHLGQGARQRAWWSKYRSVMAPSYRRFLGLEAGADKISQIQTTVMPGLLQTKEYARWITSEWEAPDLVEPLLEIRMYRQAATDSRTPRPHQTYLLDETVIRKPAGPPGLMSRQLHHLLAAAQEPEVNIRIIPDSLGPHFGMKSGSFILLEFNNALDCVLCKEETNSCTLTLERGETSHYRDKFSEILEKYALGPTESMHTIHKYASSSM